MKKVKPPLIPLKTQIIRAYLLGTGLLLAFYTLMFYQLTIHTESTTGLNRLALIAPHHFARFEQGEQGKIVIDPLLSIYDRYELLPTALQKTFSPEWRGQENWVTEQDESDFGVLTSEQVINDQLTTLYAVEDLGAYEWSEGLDFNLFQLLLFALGSIICVIAVFLMIKAAQRIASPLASLVEQLEQSLDTDFSPILIEPDAAKQGKVSQALPLEVDRTLAAINQYRDRIKQLVEREKTFTRYVSHELRTPMTVITGSLSILRRLSNDIVDKQTARIKHAVTNMEQLTATFLLLARDQATSKSLFVNEEYLTSMIEMVSETAKQNQVTLTSQLKAPFALDVEPQLFSAVIQNLLNNAINCSVDGSVSLFVSDQYIDVIDTGVGLDAKPRGYEGFGIGLQLVNDICQKYRWQFLLQNNAKQGCTATVKLCNSDQ
ncbi:sensor histidine kinase [Thalassotalea montiporae]